MSKITTWEQLSKVNVGDKLRILKTDCSKYLPVGFVAKVSDNDIGNGGITVYDKMNTSRKTSYYDICDYNIEEGDFIFEKVKSTTVTNSTLAKRKEAAKAIRKAEKDLIALIDDAGNTLDLDVDYSIDITLEYNAPVEEY